MPLLYVMSWPPTRRPVSIGVTGVSARAESYHRHTLIAWRVPRLPASGPARRRVWRSGPEL